MDGSLQQVTNLNLAYCHISTLEVAAFEGMDSLQELKLESNRLNYLHGGPSLFPANVHHVEARTDDGRTLYRVWLKGGPQVA